MARSDFDVAVIGAGPAGSATARRLAQFGCRVVLVERTRFGEPRVGESLAPAVQPLLADLGVWREFIALDPLPSYGTRSAWGEATPREQSHMISPYGNGWHVDRLAFDRMLAQAAAAAGAELLWGTALVRCEAAPRSRWLLRLEEHGTDNAAHRSQELSAYVVIDATGRAARLARWVGAHSIVFDHLVGVATHFGDIDTSREGFILLETSLEGWWYSAPASCDRMMAMFMTDSDLCGRGGLAAPVRLREALAGAPATLARLAGTMLWGPRVFSAISQRLRRSELDAPWLAVGDAALAVDPISGSGVVRALRSAQAGAQTALALLDTKTEQVIEAYEVNLDTECSAYLHDRALYYGIEKRWQESPFWQRRAPALAQIALKSA